MNNSLAPFLMYAGYFRRPIRKYLLSVTLLVVGLFIVCALPVYHYLSGLVDGISVIIAFFALMLSPVAFSAEKSEVLAWMIPVKAWQKFVTMLVFCIILVPALMLAEWSLLHYATCWFVDTPGAFTLLHIGEVNLFADTGFIWLGIVAGMMQNLLPLALVMLVVTSCKSGLVSKSVLTVMGSTFLLMIFGAIMGIAATWLAFKQGALEHVDAEAAQASDFLTVVNESSGGLLLTYYIILSVIAAIVLCGTFYFVYRRIAQRQI